MWLDDEEQDQQTEYVELNFGKFGHSVIVKPGTFENVNQVGHECLFAIRVLDLKHLKLN